jgi:hypothetical protein
MGNHQLSQLVMEKRTFAKVMYHDDSSVSINGVRTYNPTFNQLSELSPEDDAKVCKHCSLYPNTGYRMISDPLYNKVWAASRKSTG